MAFAILFLLVGKSEVIAQTCTDYATPQSVIAGMKSTDEVVRMNARSCGFKSNDKTTRGVVVKTMVEGLSQIIFDLEPPEGNVDQAQSIIRMPTFAGVNIKWADDGRTFNGEMVGGGSIRGQSLSESLSLNFSHMQVQSEKPGGQPLSVNCSVILSINLKTARIEGPLRCVGLQNQYVLVLAS